MAGRIAPGEAVGVFTWTCSGGTSYVPASDVEDKRRMDIGWWVLARHFGRLEGSLMFMAQRV